MTDVIEKVVDTTKTVSDDTKPAPKMYDETAYKELERESVTRRKKIDELEAKIKVSDDAKLSETEKDKKRIAELEKQLLDIDGSIKAGKIDSLIVEAISDKNIIDKPAAKILIKNELLSEEIVDEKVITKVVDKLIKDKPYLISTVNVNTSAGNFKKQDNDISKAPLEQLNAFISGKTNKLS